MLHFAYDALTWVAPFLFVLTLVVTVHELGHFMAARACGVAIDRFSIGFGRAIASWRDRGGVEWRVGWIPLGGYVKFAGDENAASVPDAEDLSALRSEIISQEGPGAIDRYFHFKPIWQRAVIAAAGPLANFALSVVLFAVLLMTVGETTAPAKVSEVVPGSAAAAAGFLPGDLVTAAAGRRIDSFEDLREVTVLRTGVPISFTVQRGPGSLVLVATPRDTVVDDPLGGRQHVGVLGLGSSPTRADLVTRHYGPVQAVIGGAKETWSVLDTTVYYLGRLVQGKVSADQLTGPLGMARASHVITQAASHGDGGLAARAGRVAIGLLGLAAVISVGIGFMNLLPIPVLDGGHLLFYAYEAVARRPVAATVQAVGYRVGLALLLGLMLFATTNDLQRSNVFHFLGGPFS
jgi:regulator of sigma E protease